MKKVLSTLVVFSVVGAATAAWAGAKWDDPVYIDSGMRMAYASLGSARNSGDSNQYLQVINQASSTGTPGVWVMAQDASGNFDYCYTDASNIVDAARGIESDSFVHVYWDEAKRCTYLEVRTASFTAPKNP